jgi:hypothetical protein
MSMPLNQTSDAFHLLCEESTKDIQIGVTGSAREAIKDALDEYRDTWDGRTGRISDDEFEIITSCDVPFNSKVYSINPAWGGECNA